MDTFFLKQKQQISEKLHKAKTIDAARKIAVFKTIERQVGLRGLPSVPDVSGVVRLALSNPHPLKNFIFAQENTTLPISLNPGEMPSSKQQHFQMELFKRQQEILSNIKKRANEPAPIEPLSESNSVPQTDIETEREEWSPNATAMERLESLALEVHFLCFLSLSLFFFFCSIFVHV